MSDTAKRYNFRASVPWPLLEQHLKETIAVVGSELEASTELRDLYKKQGELERLRKLLNLPGTLEIKFEKGDET